MSNLAIRLKKRLDMTTTNWQSDCCFSKRYALLRIIDDFSTRLRIKKLSDWAHKRKDNWILAYLYELLLPVIEKYKENDNTGIPIENAPIWICWWTGEDIAPPLVQQCIRSIRKNSGNHPVNLVTEKTYADYLEVPDFMLDRLKNGEIGFAHFSDYLRVCLLERYGGLWLDATIFCAANIPEDYFEIPVFTCKSSYVESRYLSNYQWVTFCLGGWSENTFYCFLKDAFELYWEKNKRAIDYLFFDHLIYLGKKYIPAVKKFFETVPINNIHRDDLQAAMNAALPASEFWNVVHEETTLYKLSWREAYMPKTPDGKLSVYGYLLEMEF